MANDLIREWAQARATTDALFDVVRADSLYDRPIAERHRIIFYLGHLEAFDWNQIWRGTLGRESFHPTFDHLFAFGIDPPPGKAPEDQPSDWPAVEEVLGYRQRVRRELDGVLSATPEQMLRVAIEHRWMHAETLAYIWHRLPAEKKNAPRPRRVQEQAGVDGSAAVEIPAGIAALGKRRDDGFGWDNEFDEHQVKVGAFLVDKYKVTHGQYLKFVEDGGEPPPFWRRTGDAWYYQGMFEAVPLPLDCPVYVTHEQAAAYARWAGRQLPSEAQFHRAAYGTPEGVERSYPWGEDTPTHDRGNFDFAGWDTVPAGSTPRGDSAFGVSELVGNGWEWTSTVFEPFPGFEPFPFYPGYSADFFDGEHYVLKGGSPRTAAPLLRRSFRNWFRPNYPYVYAAFRCVTNS